MLRKAEVKAVTTLRRQWCEYKGHLLPKSWVFMERWEQFYFLSCYGSKRAISFIWVVSDARLLIKTAQSQLKQHTPLQGKRRETGAFWITLKRKIVKEMT